MKNEDHKPRRERDPEETRYNFSGKAWVRSLPDTKRNFMGDVMKINISHEIGKVEVGKLLYGTFVVGVPSHPETVYQKIDKRNTGDGIILRFPDKSSILLNVKTGALRAVPGYTMVFVFDATLDLVKCLTPAVYMKDDYKFRQS